MNSSPSLKGTFVRASVQAMSTAIGKLMATTETQIMSVLASARSRRGSSTAFGQLAKFSPYVGGDTFTLADCAAIVHLPLVSSATKIIYGRDFLANLPVREYLARMGERPHVQRVNADRKTNTAEMLARPPKR